MGLIFGVLAVFFVLLFVLQRSDMQRVAGADAAGSSRGAAEGGRAVENPTTMAEPELWAAMAVKLIDSEATLALLHVLRALGPRVPVIAELFLSAGVERLPADPRLLPISSLGAVSAALAVTVFNPERTRKLEDALGAEEAKRG